MAVSFQRSIEVVPTNYGKRVDRIQVRLVVRDVTGTVRMTDVMLQAGTLATLWSAHPSEIKWSEG